MMLSVIVLILVCGLCRADYECLCNYNVEKPVLKSPTHSSQTIGYMYEFDCKPVTNVVGIDTVKWRAIVFEHQVLYVELDSRLTVQTCPGDPSIEDILTTRSTPITSSTSSSTTLAAEITTPAHSSVQTKARSLPTTTASRASVTSSTASPFPTSTITAARTSAASTTTISTPIDTQSTSVKVTNATTQSSTLLKTTTEKKPSSSFSTTTTTQSTVPTTTRRLTTATTTRQSTTKPTTKQTSTSGTTTITTQNTQPTTTRTVTTLPSSLGNTALCSASVRQYAQQDKEILAQNGRSCYTVVPHRVSWTHAESVCSHRGGHLFHVGSASENYFIYNLLITRFNHTVWMGLHDRGHEEKFSWTSGNPVSYTNWIPNRKSNFYSHDVEDCSVFVPYINRGQWDDIPCGSSTSVLEPFSETHRFICQFGLTTAQPGHSLSGNTNLCPSHLRYLSNRDHTTLAQYRSSCYEWINQRASWSHAESICSKTGGHLVQINDAQEETFIQQFMTSHDSQHAIWIGLHDRGHEETFTWTSGEAVVYTNWIPGRKSNFQSHNTEDCVAFIPYKQGQWDDIPCGSSSVLFGETGETHPYMCEYKINSGASGTGVIVG